MKNNNQTYKITGLISLALVLVIADIYTKNLIVEKFIYGENLPVWKGFFDITRVHNTGAAFGIFADLPEKIRAWFFHIISIVAVASLLYFAKSLPLKGKPKSWGQLSLTLIFAGAIGNTIDRIRYGYVVDFLLFHWKYKYQYPSFNIADICISIGVGILVYLLFFHAPKTKR